MHLSSLSESSAALSWIAFPHLHVGCLGAEAEQSTLPHPAMVPGRTQHCVLTRHSDLIQMEWLGSTNKQNVT